MTIASFKSKYIAVAVIAAVLVALAAGSVLVYENHAQHTMLLDTAAADSRSRVVGELSLRADDVAQHISERVAEGVLKGDRGAIVAALDTFKRDNTLLGVELRNSAGLIQLGT